jgi:hypothetical protein
VVARILGGIEQFNLENSPARTSTLSAELPRETPGLETLASRSDLLGESTSR